MATKPSSTVVPIESSPTTPLFLSVPEAARRLGVGQTTVWIALIREGKLPVVRIGRRTLVSVRALEEFAASLTTANL